jgi:hypothetical protein
MARYTLGTQHNIGSITIDTDTDMDTIRRACPVFFKHPHGKRETFTVYRGFLIVRNTNTFGGETMRCTTLYAYDVDRKDTRCILSNVKSMAVAKRMIRFYLALTAPVGNAP